ncbi:MAG TPA: outer membrane beta-barrel protein [Sphingobium sp.]|nr:outer membrane beta-barrel protein [Sphingobium sp.]
MSDALGTAKARGLRHWAGAGLFILSTLTCGTSPAFAQTDDKPFDGFRLELMTGYDDEGVDFDDDVFDGGKQSQSGWLFGFGAGYDYQTGPLVLGLETELTESTAGRDETFEGVRPAQPIAGVPTPVTTSLSIDAGGDWYIGARAGYTVTPQTLLYLKLGYTHQKIDIDGEGLDNGVPFSFDEKVGLDGFRFGVGGEYAFSNSFFGKLEYRYTNYNNGDLDVRGADIDLDPLFEGIDVVRHQFLLGVGYRF